MQKISAGKLQSLNLPSHHSITASVQASRVGGMELVEAVKNALVEGGVPGV
jgi:hypothetical protein